MARQFFLAFLLLSILLLSIARPAAAAQTGYLGFDRNVYPGDAALPALRKIFRYTGYWLNNPPGAGANTWTGKRVLLKQNGFGFLVLFNGRLEAALNGRNPAALGTADGAAAADAAAREGFAPNVLIFLDQEEGGRLTAAQADYLFAWVDAVRAAGDRAGIYCSGITVTDESGPISTARNIAQLEAARREHAARNASGPKASLALWIANDQCPPSPGCTEQPPPLSAAFSPMPAVSAPVWQYAQSPRRREFTASCPHNYAPDGNCYAPELKPESSSFVDLNIADSLDPSETP